MLEPLKSCGSVRWKAAARTAIDAVSDPTGPKVRLYRPCCGRLSMSMPALGCVCGELVQCSWRLWAILSCAKSVQSKRFRRQPQVEKTGPLQSSLVARECLPISGACEQPQRPNIPKERAQIDMCQPPAPMHSVTRRNSRARGKRIEEGAQVKSQWEAGDLSSGRVGGAPSRVCDGPEDAPCQPILADPLG